MTNEPETVVPDTGAEAADAADAPVVTLAEALALAIERLQMNDLQNAGLALRRILEVVPDQPDALQYLGMLSHREGRGDEAVGLMRRSLELAPDQADWHSNLGIVLQASDQLEDAIECFRHALALNPAHPNALSNMGVLLRLLGRNEEAEAAYRRAIELDPAHADAFHNLAILLDATGRTPEAVVAFCRAMTLRPQHPEVRRVLALCYCAIGERDKAISLCEAWVADAPDDPIAAHTLAAVSGRAVPARADDEYVRRVFDSFSSTFEAKLARLHYRAPEFVLRSLAASGVAQNKALDVLDAGCGTGLCGPLLAPYARRLIGVDLSAGMLRHAEDKHVYDELHAGELTAYLEAHPGAFDVIVSADTIVYFGALDDVTRAAAQALRPGGVFVFTLEEWKDEAPMADGTIADAGYSLRPHGRYTHRAAYVERLLRDAGLETHIDRDELRKEQGLPVAGLIVRAVRPFRSGEGDRTTPQAAGETHA